MTTKKHVFRIGCFWAFGTHVVFQPCHNILNDHKQHLLLAREVRELTALACLLSCLVIELVRQTKSSPLNLVKQ